MSGEKLGGSNFGSRSVDNQETSDKATQWAQAAMEKAKQQPKAEKVVDGTTPVDLSSGKVETTKIEHDSKPKSIEDLSNKELENRAKKADQKLAEAQPGTKEFEAARRELIDAMKEQGRRYAEQNKPEPEPEKQKDDQKVEQAKADEAEAPKNLREKIKEKCKKNKIFQKVVKSTMALLIAASAIGVGANALMGKQADKANADTKIERSHDQTKMHEMANGIHYNYDGIFGDISGSGYNQDKTGQYDFAPSQILGNVWQDEDGARKALISLVEQQPDLNGADYLCGLEDGDLNKIEMTKAHGTDLSTISEWMGSDKEFNQEATNLLKDIFNDPNTTVEFGPLTKWSGAGNYVNAGGIINDTQTLNDMNNVKILGSQTYEDEHTAVIRIKTAAGSELLIKAGSFDDDGNFVQEDGCSQLIWTVEAAGKVFYSVPSNPDSPVPPSPTPPPTPPKPWGKSGDTHAGDGIFNKDQVNPATRVTEYQSDHANDGNKGGQSAAEVDHGTVDRGGNRQQETSPDRGKTHSDAEQESRIHGGDF